MFIGDDDADEIADLNRSAVSLGLEYRVNDVWTAQIAGGVSHGGQLQTGSGIHVLEPGFVAVVGVGKQIGDGRDGSPFIVVGGTISASSVTTQQQFVTQPQFATQRQTDSGRGRLTAIDGRVSLTVGKLLAETVAPYATGRLFGGPIFWQREGRPLAGGSDVYHFQLGAGLLVTTGDIDAFLEVIPAGERALTVGAATSF